MLGIEERTNERLDCQVTKLSGCLNGANRCSEALNYSSWGIYQRTNGFN